MTTAGTLNIFQLKVSMVKGVFVINYYSGFQFKINWLTGVHGRFGDTLMCVSELDITPVLDRTLVVSTYSYTNLSFSRERTYILYKKSG